jgi:hypothetical protein
VTVPKQVDNVRIIDIVFNNKRVGHDFGFVRGERKGKASRDVCTGSAQS